MKNSEYVSSELVKAVMPGHGGQQQSHASSDTSNPARFADADFGAGTFMVQLFDHSHDLTHGLHQDNAQKLLKSMLACKADTAHANHKKPNN